MLTSRTRADTEGFALGFAAAVKQDVDVPVIGVGRIRFPGARGARGCRRASSTSSPSAAALIADPEWVAKAREGPRRSRSGPASGSCRIAVAAHGIVACAVNAQLGREAGVAGGRPVDLRAHAASSLRAAAPGGLEAARVAAEAGHDVVLYERSDFRRRPAARSPPPGRRAVSCSTSSPTSSASSRDSASRSASRSRRPGRRCSRMGRSSLWWQRVPSRCRLRFPSPKRT